MTNKTITQLDAAQSLNDNMVIAVQDTNTTYKTTLADIKDYCGAAIIPEGSITITENGTYDVTNYARANVSVSGGSTGKYQLLQRISDDSNNEIGTVSGFFIDANDVEYAVVCLDATYRTDSAKWASATGDVTNMPLYNNWTIWEAPETATENTTLILASKTSSACTHCRQYSFVIDGTTYYGQLPNIIELTDIARHRTAINAADTSGGSITFATNKGYWSSSQSSSNGGWYIKTSGSMINNTKTYDYYVCPVLEIPLED